MNTATRAALPFHGISRNSRTVPPLWRLAAGRPNPRMEVPEQQETPRPDCGGFAGSQGSQLGAYLAASGRSLPTTPRPMEPRNTRSNGPYNPVQQHPATLRNHLILKNGRRTLRGCAARILALPRARHDAGKVERYTQIADLNLEERRAGRHDLGCIQDDLDVRPAALTVAVRAENLIRGCDQQRCPPCSPAVMITGHVPAVRLPPDHADDLMAAAVPA